MGDLWTPFESICRVWNTIHVSTFPESWMGCFCACKFDCWSGYYLSISYLSELNVKIKVCLLQFLQFSALNKLCKKYERGYVPFGEALYIGFRDGPASLKWAAIPSGILVNAIMVFFQFFSLCLYFGYMVQVITGLGIADDKYYACLYLFPVVVLVYFLKEPRIIGMLSIIAVIFFTIICAMILYDATIVGISPKRHVAFNDSVELPYVIFYSLYILQSTGAVSFYNIFINLSPKFQVLSVEREMKNPKIFLKAGGALNFAIFFWLMIFIFTGFLGYWVYGEEVKDNMLDNMENPNLRIACNCLILFELCISFNINGRCLIDILWHDLIKKAVHKKSSYCLYEHIMRYCIVMAASLLNTL